MMTGMTFPKTQLNNALNSIHIEEECGESLVVHFMNQGEQKIRKTEAQHQEKEKIPTFLCLCAKRQLDAKSGWKKKTCPYFYSLENYVSSENQRVFCQ